MCGNVAGAPLFVDLHSHSTASDVDAGVVVAAELRRHDAEAGEDCRRVDIDDVAREVGLDEDVDLRCEGDDAAVVVDGHRGTIGDQARRAEVDFLKVRIAVAGGVETEGGELRRDVVRAELETAAAGLAPFEQVAGQEADVRRDRRRLDAVARCSGGRVNVERSCAQRAGYGEREHYCREGRKAGKHAA